MSDLLLYRAVRPAELVSLGTLARFTNIVGLECKYFTESLSDARRYAELAERSYEDGPYSIVATAIDLDRLPAGCRIVVDGGIRAVIIPNSLLDALKPPIIMED